MRILILLPQFFVLWANASSASAEKAPTLLTCTDSFNYDVTPESGSDLVVLKNQTRKVWLFGDYAEVTVGPSADGLTTHTFYMDCKPAFGDYLSCFSHVFGQAFTWRPENNQFTYSFTHPGHGADWFGTTFAVGLCKSGW